MTFEPKDAAKERGEIVLFDDRGARSIPTDMPLSIGNVSRMLGISRLRLRLYEALGLIARRHRFGDGLVYRWEDCARLTFIIKARRAGLGVGQLLPLMKAADAGASLATIDRAKLQCLDLINRLEARLRPLRDAQAEIDFFYRALSEKSPEKSASVPSGERDGHG